MRRGLVWGLVAAGVLVAALSERWLAPRVVTGRLATGPALWIWASPAGDGVTPAAFWVSRDFSLAAVPAEAELLVLADEEYVLYLNGQRVGGNRYLPGAALDRYRVESLLAPGRNRLVVELRSGRRAGGLLLRLRGAGGLDVVTGPDWRMVRHHRKRDRDPAASLEPGRPVRVWGSPPTGRWRQPQPGALRPLHGEVLLGEPRRLPMRLWAGAAWWRVAPLRPGSPSLGAHVLFDFGGRVTGFAGLHLADRAGAKALLYFRDQPADPDWEPPDAYALGPRGQAQWIDSVPRSFRYLTVIAPQGIKGAFLLAADPQRAAPLAPPRGAGTGVFAVAGPPPLVSPVEHEIRGELEGLAGLVGGQPD